MSHRPLRLLLDSAALEDWHRFIPMGLYAGVTTNPLLMQRANMPCTFDSLHIFVRNAQELQCEELHLQVWGIDEDAWYRCAQALISLWDRVYVKLPVTEAGFRVAKRLKMQGFDQITMTAAYTASQVAAAVAIEAAYVAPYFGRMVERTSPEQAHRQLQTMFAVTQRPASHTRLLLASLRSVAQLEELFALGADCATLQPTIANVLLASDLTTEAVADFEAAASAP